MNCGSAFEPGASGLPYYCTPPVTTPAVIGAVREPYGDKTQLNWRRSQGCAWQRCVDWISVVVCLFVCLLSWNASPKAYSSDVTKHSDYFVWKDTSERVARRCDDIVDKKRVNSCILKHLFLEGVEQPETSPKTPGNALSDALLTSPFQDFAPDAANRRNALRAVFWNRASRGFN